jgi:hypothetical protein
MARAVQADDGVATKVAKYVPAEMVTVATGFFAAFDPNDRVLVAALLIGAALNVVYLLSVARADKTAQKPPQAFYALSAAAFLLWSASVIDEVAAFAHLDTDPKRAFVLTFAAFALPLADSINVRRTPR